MGKTRYGIIYLFINNINKKIYVGLTTCSFETRYGTSNSAIYSRVSNDHLKRSIDKYGLENFTIIKEFDVAYSKEELDALEDMYICIYNTLDPKYGYNKKRGGAKGKQSEETRKKNSEVHKGIKPSEETRKKLSEAHKGENNSFFGKKQSDEVKKKISIANSGDNNGMRKKGGHTKETRDKMKTVRRELQGRTIMCIETGKIYYSFPEAAEDTGCRSDSINHCCLGRYKYAKDRNGNKLSWKYVD